MIWREKYWNQWFDQAVYSAKFFHKLRKVQKNDANILSHRWLVKTSVGWEQCNSNKERKQLSTVSSLVKFEILCDDFLHPQQ